MRAETARFRFARVNGKSEVNVSFNNPLFLCLLFLLPVLIYLFYKRRRKPSSLLFSNIQPVKEISSSFHSLAYKLGNILKFLALASLIIALARPQIQDIEVLSGEGLDFMIVLDMSGSMNAIDRKPSEIAEIQSKGEEPKNRFETAREVIKDFVRGRQEDRIGLVIFSSKAYLKFPLTLDYSTVMTILDSLLLDNGIRNREGKCTNNCTISGESTAIGDALARAYKRLQDSQAKSRNIILITDGDNNAGSVDPLTISKYIGEQPEDKKVRIYTFLIGSGQKPLIPAVNPFTGALVKTPDGRQMYDYPEQPYPTNPELLKQIAEITKGNFYDSFSEEKFRKDFEDLVRTHFTMNVHRKYKEAYLPFVLAGIFMLMFDGILRSLILRKFP
jgi:Ca-activated chloride channel family protein